MINLELCADTRRQQRAIWEYSMRQWWAKGEMQLVNRITSTRIEYYATALWSSESGGQTSLQVVSWS